MLWTNLDLKKVYTPYKALKCVLRRDSYFKGKHLRSIAKSSLNANYKVVGASDACN